MSGKQLPDKLKKELPHYRGEGASYSARDLVLAYMANAGRPCNTTELMTYVYEVKKKVMKRGYFYQMIYKLRRTGIIGVGISTHGSDKEWQITSEGRALARPYLTPTGHGTG